VRRGEQHLSIEQIENLADAQIHEASGRQVSELLREAQRHLETCESCRELVAMHKEGNLALRGLREEGSEEATSACPSEAKLEELAAGILDSAEAEKILSHAVECQRCSRILYAAARLFSEEKTTGEADAIEKLRSSNSEWQRELADKLARKSRQSTEPKQGSTKQAARIQFWPKWILAGAAVVLLSFSTLWLWPYLELRQVNHQLAQAYTERRTLELRIPGAAYAPLRVARGNGESRLEAPRPLLEAEAKIARKQKEARPSAAWLIAGARADLLEWNYDAAIRTLQEAEALAPEQSSIKIDLATAYFERAQATGYVSDFGTAIETISRVLEKDSANTVALFNRALIYERLTLYSEAASDWKHYLALDPSGDWSAEAREHLGRVEQKLNEKKKVAEAGDLGSPAMIAGDAATTISDDSLDMRIEEYQRTVLTKWAPELVKAESQPGRGRSVVLRKAVERISRLMAKHHGDAFLQDLRVTPQEPANPRYERSITALSLAISANESGREQEAIELSQEAESGFRDTGNRAGALRARFERAYAQQFSSQVLPCQRLAESVANGAHELGYKWLEAQALVEWGYCANMDGSLPIASQKLKEAASVAQEAGYEESLERAMVGEAAMQWQTGSVAQAWNLVLEGLQRYWNHPSSDVRGTSLYSVLDLIAEETQQWHLQEAILRESLPLMDRGKDPLAAAQTRTRLAGTELMLNQYEQAEADLEQSLQAFRSAPPTASTLAQQITVSVNLAKAEMQSREFQRSWERLQSLQPAVANLHDNLSLLDYYGTLGEVCRNLGRRDDAESADRKAIEIYQSSLAALDEPGERLAWFHEASFAYRSFVQLKLNENDALGALAIWEAYRNSSSLSHKKDSPGAAVSGNRLESGRNAATGTPGPGAFQRQLADGQEKILTYAKLPDGMFVWIRSGQDVKVEQIDGSWQEIHGLRTLFIQECSTPSSNIADIKDHGSQLYRKLILPLAGQFSTDDTIIFEPDEELTDLPLGALVDESGQFFGANHSIIISMGSATDSQPGFSRKVGNHDSILLVVAGGRRGEEKLQDPLAEEEVENVGSLFLSPTTISSASIPQGRFQELLSNTSIFHYAGHSGTTVRGGELLIPSRDPNGSVNELSLRSEDILRSDLHNCHLVVLSACETARGEVGRWLNRENLALAFLDAGVPQVVATRWQVDSKATTELMKEFYSRLIKGGATPEALRLAVAKTRSETGFSHPYYWAAFMLLARV
jgi:CHAT domain-containing protein/tetratricopeptide (TPR) repeat protein